ncbi:hypothetical protein DFH09DRAFT_1275783 [Mycena vulgaris]|nr:hypothetical protein DFH09DRAFT_1275783 [Mycena vulgaris]
MAHHHPGETVWTEDWPQCVPVLAAFRAYLHGTVPLRNAGFQELAMNFLELNMRFTSLALFLATITAAYASTIDMRQLGCPGTKVCPTGKVLLCCKGVDLDSTCAFARFQWPLVRMQKPSRKTLWHYSVYTHAHSPRLVEEEKGSEASEKRGKSKLSMEEIQGTAIIERVPWLTAGPNSLVGTYGGGHDTSLGALYWDSRCQNVLVDLSAWPRIFWQIELVMKSVAGECGY